MSGRPAFGGRGRENPGGGAPVVRGLDPPSGIRELRRHLGTRRGVGARIRADLRSLQRHRIVLRQVIGGLTRV